MRIKWYRETSEPNTCFRFDLKCKEELNGLNCGVIDFGDGFKFEIWLCDNCKKEFKKLRESKLGLSQEGR